MTYTAVTALRVYLANTNPAQFVGRLILQDRQIYFEYDPAFIQSGIELSPFKLPLQLGAVPCPHATPEGIFGVFADSLPDGWGRLLLDREMVDRGVMPGSLSPIDRLAHVGAGGMGALCYEPDCSEATTFDPVIDLNRFAAESQHVLEGGAGDMLTELRLLAGSSAGARPKVLVGVSTSRRSVVHGLSALPAHYTPWLIKFAATHDAIHGGAVEYAYSLMARAAGVEMMPTHLFPAEHGPGYFGVERFDRLQGLASPPPAAKPPEPPPQRALGARRIHMHTVAGLLHADYRVPTVDYAQVLQLTHILTKNIQDVYALFRLAAFNVLAHNRDDHIKNFSFLMETTGAWRCAPAYDLTFAHGPGGQQTMLVLGEGKAPSSEHLRALAKHAGIPKKIVEPILDDVRAAVADWKKYAKRAHVPAKTAQVIGKVLQGIT